MFEFMSGMSKYNHGKSVGTGDGMHMHRVMAWSRLPQDSHSWECIKHTETCMHNDGIQFRN